MGLRKQFINILVFLTSACAVGFHNNNNNTINIIINNKKTFTNNIIHWCYRFVRYVTITTEGDRICGNTNN